MIDIQTILSGVLSAVAVGCLGVVAKVFGQYGSKIAAEVWKMVETKAKASNLEYVLKEAKVIWYQVEEDWRVSEKVRQGFISKSSYFDDMMKRKFNMNQNQIASIRQSIAGAYNEGKKESINSVSIRPSS